MMDQLRHSFRLEWSPSFPKQMIRTPVSAMSRGTASRHYLVTLVLMVAASSAGCPANEPAASKPVDSAEKAEKRNADLLDNAWSMLQPEALRVSSNRGAIVAVLNEWLTNTEELTKQRTQLSADAAELLKQLLPAPQFEAVTRQRFSPRDADHIGTCIVEQAMAAHAGGSDTSFKLSSSGNTAR